MARLRSDEPDDRLGNGPRSIDHELAALLGPAIGKAITRHARFRWEDDGTPGVATAINLGAITTEVIHAIRTNRRLVLEALDTTERTQP